MFSGVHLTVNRHAKIALIGNNGAGKSTLLKIMAGELSPQSGSVNGNASLYFVPQVFGQYNHVTIAQALRVQDKLHALKEILNGHVTDNYLALLDDDWTIEERCLEALQYWQLGNLDLMQPMETLSGGQKTKVFLAGMAIHKADIVLLDEPTNHLDLEGRQLLYDFIRSHSSALVVVSHDRTLLNLLDQVAELGRQGLTLYGGNYDFYAEQKRMEQEALYHDVKNKEKELRKARDAERETMERQQKLDARGKRKQEKAGLPTILMNTFKNNAEKTGARLKGVHTERIGAISQELNDLRKELPGTDKMKFGFDNSAFHIGKILFEAAGINVKYEARLVWAQDISLQITSGDRIALKGANGVGKTTLIKIILGELAPTTGTVRRAENRSVYVDQDYSFIQNQYSVYEQVQLFNTAALQEHEIKNRLHRFLFSKEDWDKRCGSLSGGEKMKLVLCCLTVSNQAPDMIILDEPTNNLDIQNIEMLTGAINEYRGTLIVVSHDEYFLKEINVDHVIQL